MHGMNIKIRSSHWCGH